MLGAATRILLRDLARHTGEVAARLLLAAAVAAILSGFALALPAYRDSFVRPLELARFDIDLSCSCTTEDLLAVSNALGVERVAPVLGVADVPVRFGDIQAAAWTYAVDDAADAEMLPLSPQYLIEGSVELGANPSGGAVLDHELARLLSAEINDRIVATFAGHDLDIVVTGIAGPANKLRGPAMLIDSSLLRPLIPVTSEIAEAPYTELLIAGSASPSAITDLFAPGTVGIYTREELIEIQQAQIEVSQPVIDIASYLAAIGLLGFVVLLAWQSVDHWRRELILAEYLGQSAASRLTSLLLWQAPMAVAMGIGVAGGSLIIINGYFGRVGTVIQPGVAGLAGLSVAIASLVITTVALAIRSSRRAEWLG